jgi:hypothetical protein
MGAQLRVLLRLAERRRDRVKKGTRHLSWGGQREERGDEKGEEPGCEFHGLAEVD